MKTKNFAKKGFTLIELLVVIVIIGILATIGVATFQGYFAQARDSERQAAVRNAATVLKTAIAVGDVSNVPADIDTIAEVDAQLASSGGYALPADVAGGGEYRFVTGDVSTNAAGEFAFFVCGEENRASSEIFIDGTATAISAINSVAATLCPTTAATVAEAAADTAIDGADIPDAAATWSTLAQD